MPIESPSPFARPMKDVRIVKGAPAPERPDRTQRDALAARLKQEAADLLDATLAAQDRMLAGKSAYDLSWLADRHVLIAGATGQGLGGALAAAVLPRLGARGTLAAVARDARYTVGYYSGEALQAKATSLGLGERFRFHDRGLALEGDPFDNLVASLTDLRADRVIYLNMVAAANSGVLPDYPPIYVPDVDAEGLFQWELAELTARQIETSKFIMGEMAVQFPARLAAAGVSVAVEGYAGWRGSHDVISRLPERPEYGRQGAYSGSLWLPKDVLDDYVASAQAAGVDRAGPAGERVVQTHFFPIMRTRALAFIPGGTAMAKLYETLMAMEGIQHVGIAELALSMLDRLGQATKGRRRSPWQRHDMHEAPLDPWFRHVLPRLSQDPSSPYHYRKWLAREENS